MECGASLDSNGKSDDASDGDSDEPDETFEGVDLSDIDPRTDWECFGCFEKDHSECKDCPFKNECGDES